MFMLKFGEKKILFRLKKIPGQPAKADQPNTALIPMY